MDGVWPKFCTVLALTVGMVVAVSIKATAFPTQSLIIFAQALTVLGNPLLAGAMLWLATRPDLRKQRAVPGWILTLASLGFLAVLSLSVRTAVMLYFQIRDMIAS